MPRLIITTDDGIRTHTVDLDEEYDDPGGSEAQADRMHGLGTAWMRARRMDARGVSAVLDEEDESCVK